MHDHPAAIKHLAVPFFKAFDTGGADRVMAGLGPVGISIFMLAVTYGIAGHEIGTIADLIARIASN